MFGASVFSECNDWTWTCVPALQNMCMACGRIGLSGGGGAGRYKWALVDELVHVMKGNYIASM